MGKKKSQQTNKICKNHASPPSIAGNPFGNYNEGWNKTLAGTEVIDNKKQNSFNKISNILDCGAIENLDNPEILTEIVLSVFSNKFFDPKMLIVRDAEIDPNILALVLAVQAEQSHQRRKNMSKEQLEKARTQSAEWKRKTRAEMSPEQKEKQRAKDAERMRKARAKKQQQER